MKVIGLTSHAGAGKDYTHLRLSKYLRDRQVQRVAFADGVRREIEALMLSGAWGDRLPALWDKPYPEGIRFILQHYGTEFRRAQDPDYWVKAAVEYVRELELGSDDVLVFTDVRFLNEAEAIQDELDGFVFEVWADEDARRERLGGCLPPAHASEVIDFPTDGTVVNDLHFDVPDLMCQYLGLNWNCRNCRSLVPHPFHDNGSPNALWEFHATRA